MIRPARAADASAIAAIYEHYARETAVTFANHAPEERHYIEAITLGDYPFLVDEENGRITGFAYAAAFRPHDAYRWDVELTLYLLPGHTGRGVGTALMKALLRLLRRQRFLTAYSCITANNAVSLRLHDRLGFEMLGTFPDTGYKLGQWHSVVWMAFSLGEKGNPPPEPVPFRDLPAAEVAGLIGGEST